METKQLIKQHISEKLSENPYVAPISNRLVELGLSDYRQYIVDKHNLVFYKINEDRKEVVLLAAMDSRQSIQKLLYELTLLV